MNDVRENDHYVGTNLTRVFTMAFRDPGMNLTWTMIKEHIPPRTSIYSLL